MTGEERLQTAAALLANPSLLKKKPQRYFLKETGKNGYQPDLARITAAEKYDGFLAISTNTNDLSPTEVLEQYKQLYKIEHTFRTFKSHLETRPMFHWTDKRIEGHICLCYMAYTLLNYVLLKANEKQQNLTENSLRKLLDNMQVSLLQHNHQQVYVQSKPQLVVFQVNDRVIPGTMSLNFVNAFYTLEPEGRRQAVDKFCDYYSDRPCKEVYYFYDHTAVGKQNGDTRNYIWKSWASLSAGTGR